MKDRNMDKSLLDRFINKYSLGGAVQSVVLKAEDGKGLSTKFLSDDRDALGIISTPAIEIEEGEYGVFDTARLRALLGVLDSEVKVRVIKKDGKATGFGMSDGRTKVTFVLADKENIPVVPDLKKMLPTFEIVIKVDEKLAETFTKAKAALPEVETFTVLADDKTAHLVVGYSGESLNTNRIAIEAEVDAVESIEPIAFSARYLREIFLSNKEMKEGKLRISSAGMAHLSFVVEGFDINYYLFKVEKMD